MAVILNDGILRYAQNDTTQTMMNIIDGKKIAEDVRNDIGTEVKKLEKKGISPALAVILVGEDPASKIYVKNKKTACEKAGIKSLSFDLARDTQEKEVLKLIEKLNRDTKVHAILVQLPLPEHIDEKKIIEAIDPKKDADCFHPFNVGLLMQGTPSVTPCTPAAIMHLLYGAGCDPKGKRAVVVGRSNIVGKPVALMLVQAHATVTICHSKTLDLEDEIKNADIVVAAIGKPKFIKGSWLKKDAVVIDVGINRTPEGKLVGDVDFDEAKKYASAITPVPGGVGPMTIAMLLKNTLKLAST